MSRVVRELPENILKEHVRGSFQAGQILQYKKPFGSGGYHISTSKGGIYYLHGYMKTLDNRERLMVLERIDQEFSTGGTIFIINVSEHEVEHVRL